MGFAGKTKRSLKFRKFSRYSQSCGETQNFCKIHRKTTIYNKWQKLREWWESSQKQWKPLKQQEMPESIKYCVFAKIKVECLARRSPEIHKLDKISFLLKLFGDNSIDWAFQWLSTFLMLWYCFKWFFKFLLSLYTFSLWGSFWATKKNSALWPQLWRKQKE